MNAPPTPTNTKVSVGVLQRVCRRFCNFNGFLAPLSTEKIQSIRRDELDAITSTVKDEVLPNLPSKERFFGSETADISSNEEFISAWKASVDAAQSIEEPQRYTTVSVPCIGLKSEMSKILVGWGNGGLISDAKAVLPHLRADGLTNTFFYLVMTRDGRVQCVPFGGHFGMCSTQFLCNISIDGVICRRLLCWFGELHSKRSDHSLSRHSRWKIMGNFSSRRWTKNSRLDAKPLCLGC